MNGLVPMTVGSWEYYEHELSVEDYFVGRGQEAGVWVGSGAAVLGLSGQVEEGQLARLFDDGRHPVSGAPLGVPYRHDSKRTVGDRVRAVVLAAEERVAGRRLRRRRDGGGGPGGP